MPLIALPFPQRHRTWLTPEYVFSGLVPLSAPLKGPQQQNLVCLVALLRHLHFMSCLKPGREHPCFVLISIMAAAPHLKKQKTTRHDTESDPPVVDRPPSRPGGTRGPPHPRRRKGPAPRSWCPAPRCTPSSATPNGSLRAYGNHFPIFSKPLLPLAQRLRSWAKAKTNQETKHAYSPLRRQGNQTCLFSWHIC